MESYRHSPDDSPPETSLQPRKRTVDRRESEMTRFRKVSVLERWMRAAQKSRQGSDDRLAHQDQIEEITDEVLRQVTPEPSRSFDATMAALAQLTLKASHSLIVIPSTPWKHHWDLFVIVLVIYNAVMIPLKVAFPGFQASTGWDVFEHTIDFLFLVDMLLHARTAISRPDGRFELSGTAIMQKYLRGWFTVDLLATVPFELLLAGVAGESSVAVTSIGALKCIRLLRLGRVLRYVQHLRYANVWRVGRLVAFYVLFLHWCSCAWYFVGTVQRDPMAWTIRANTSVMTMWQVYCLAAARIAQVVGGANLAEVETATERSVATVLFIVGAVFNATLFGQVALLLQNRNSIHQAYQDKMDAVNQNLRLLELPEDLQRRVRFFYEYSFHQHRMLDYRHFVDDLSPTLSGEVSLYIHRDMIERVPVFKGCSPDFMVDLVSSLAHRIYLPGDFIVRYGETGDEMYFINTGTCKVLSKERSTVIARLFRRDYFGELALVTDAPRTATVQAETYCDVSYLQRAHLDSLCSAYPAMARQIQTVTAARIKEWKRTLKTASSCHDVAKHTLLADNVAAKFLERVRARVATQQTPTRATRRRSSAYTVPHISTSSSGDRWGTLSPSAATSAATFSTHSPVHRVEDDAFLKLDCSVRALNVPKSALEPNAGPQRASSKSVEAFDSRDRDIPTLSPVAEGKGHLTPIRRRPRATSAPLTVSIDSPSEYQFPNATPAVELVTPQHSPVREDPSPPPHGELAELKRMLQAQNETLDEQLGQTRRFMQQVATRLDRLEQMMGSRVVSGLASPGRTSC